MSAGQDLTRSERTRMDRVVKPHRHTADSFTSIACHALQSAFEVALRNVSQLALPKQIAIRAHQVVGTTDDGQRTTRETLETRVESSMASTRVQNPAVQLLRWRHVVRFIRAGQTQRCDGWRSGA